MSPFLLVWAFLSFLFVSLPLFLSRLLHPELQGLVACPLPPTEISLAWR